MESISTGFHGVGFLWFSWSCFPLVSMGLLSQNWISSVKVIQVFDFWKSCLGAFPNLSFFSTIHSVKHIWKQDFIWSVGFQPFIAWEKNGLRGNNSKLVSVPVSNTRSINPRNDIYRNVRQKCNLQCIRQKDFTCSVHFPFSGYRVELIA